MKDTAAVTERPILLSGPMVRAILDGRKTQTRRIIKPQPPECAGRIFCEHFEPTVIDRHDEMQPGAEIFGAYDEDGEWGAKCPYGQPGDRLWVRETWCHSTNVNGEKQWPDRPHTEVERLENGNLWSAVIFRADGETEWLDDDGWRTDKSFWKPSIHMPRWASRILLEIVSVRVERLQDISEADARAEGMEPFGVGYRAWEGMPHVLHARHAFQDCWRSLNGTDGWHANPWVWVVEFKRVES